MRKIVLFLISALAMITSFFVIWWQSLGYYQPSENWLSAVYLVKEHRAESITSPKIIILSGSNSLFGIDSEQLQEAMNMPVVNLAGHAGLSFDFLVEKTLLHARPGDKVVMPLELAYYKRTSALTSWQVSNMESWGHAHIEKLLFTALHYFRYTSWDDTFKRLFAQKEVPFFELNEVLAVIDKNTAQMPNRWHGYYYLSMNRFGDFLISEQPRDTVIDTDYTDGKVSDYSLSKLIDLKGKLSEMGADLIVTWPVTLKSKKFDLSLERSRERLHNLEISLENRGITVKCDPNIAHFDREYFFDDSNHLNMRGAIKRTRALADCLNGNANLRTTNT